MKEHSTTSSKCNVKPNSQLQYCSNIKWAGSFATFSNTYCLNSGNLLSSLVTYDTFIPWSFSTFLIVVASLSSEHPTKLQSYLTTSMTGMAIRPRWQVRVDLGQDYRQNGGYLEDDSSDDKRLVETLWAYCYARYSWLNSLQVTGRYAIETRWWTCHFWISFLPFE